MGIDEVLNTLKAMHHALEFYANGSNYQATTGHIVVLDDAGEQARTALNKLDELGERAEQHRQTSAKHCESSRSVAGVP
jgi:protein-disulfide isomerase-like protein with CxxC motif